jgi:Arc/MetJ-type ribon-helix-helix transcriptional regulator
MARRLSGSITVRLGPRALRLVRAAAKKKKKSASEVVREMIEADLQPELQREKGVSAMDLSRAWVGAIRDAKLPPGKTAREALEGWSPDRR